MNAKELTPQGPEAADLELKIRALVTTVSEQLAAGAPLDEVMFWLQLHMAKCTVQWRRWLREDAERWLERQEADR